MDSNLTQTVLSKSMITNAKQAVSNYITTATGLYADLNKLIITLTASDFQGDAAEGFKDFFTNKVTPVLTSSLTDKGTSLMAGIEMMLDNISSSLLDGVDPQLGAANRTAGDANVEAKTETMV